MQYRWSAERAEYQFACAVDRTHQTFRDSMAEWTGRHFAALLKDARESVWDGPEHLALSLFDTFVQEIAKIHRSVGAHKMFELNPLVSEIRRPLLLAAFPLDPPKIPATATTKRGKGGRPKPI